MVSVAFIRVQFLQIKIILYFYSIYFACQQGMHLGRGEGISIQNRPFFVTGTPPFAERVLRY